MNKLNKNLMERVSKIMENSKPAKSHYDCEKCRDFGYIFVKDENNNEYAKPCECLRKKEIMDKLDKCGLSDVFKKKTFDSYNCENAVQLNAMKTALDYCKNFESLNNSLLICGKSGAGKTHLGIATMMCLIEKNIGCKYVEYNNMIVSLKQSVMDEENHMRQMEKLLNCRVLFVDDFLKGKVSDVDLNYIYRIINSRYLKNKALIISTEKSINELLSWDEAVASRILEMCGSSIIVFGDKNVRNHRLEKIR